MNDSISLLNGLKFNKNKQTLQEGMRDMDTMNTNETIAQDAYDTMSAYSEGRHKQAEIQEQYNKRKEQYQQLLNKFDTIKDKLTNSINNYISSDNQNDLRNKGGTNIIVSEPSIIKENEVKFEGCYKDTENRAIKNMQPEGYVFNIESCAQRAIDNGKTIFGVQNVNNDGLAKCFIGDDLESAKQYGKAYQTKHYWYARNKNGYVHKGKLLKLFNNGVMMMFNIDNVSNEENDVLYSTYRDGDGKIVDGCNKDNGGTVQNLVASYGMNCLVNDYKPTGNAEKPSIGNYTSYFKNIIGTEKGVYNIKFEKGDPASKCRKDFDVNYTCGDGPTKSINIPGPSDGKPVIVDCSTEAKLCGGIRMVMQNDGNLVILDGNDKLVWESGTANSDNVGDLVIDEWIQKSINGRDYLKAGETMKRGDILTSSNGKNILVFDNGGYLILIKSNGDKCKTIDGKRYGASYSNAVYSLPQSNIDNLGSMIYLDNESNTVYSYPNFRSSNYDLQDNKFILIGPYNSYDQDISSLSASSLEQCEEAASKIPDCGGFVYNKTQQRCFLKGKQMWPKSQRVLDNDCIMKIKAPKVNIDESCPIDFLTVNSSNFDLYPKASSEMNSSVKCGLRKMINENKGEYDKENQVLMKELENVVNEISVLSQQRDANMNTIPELRNKIQRRFNEYKQLRTEYKKYHNKTLDPTLSQYKRDSEMNRNMYKTDSTMLALLGVGGLLLAMKFMK